MPPGRDTILPHERQLRRVHLDLCGSTNDEARRLAAEAPGRPILVSADRQTAGRGRQGRKWSSPLGGAWMTLAWPVAPNTPAAALEAAPLIIGLAAADAIDAVMRAAAPAYDPRHLTIKWPNDLLLEGRKVAGILCERELTPAAPLLAGVGINAAVDPASITTDLQSPPRFPAASLSEVSPRPIDPSAIIDAFATSVARLLPTLITEGFTPGLAHAVEHRLAYLNGPPVTLTNANTSITATILGLDARGRLRIRDEHNTEHTITSGELSLIAPDEPQATREERPTP